jgi:2-polyprenyl-6-methoxyphenol hydroxylase-like FAD-dependent oxidoreductase
VIARDVLIQGGGIGGLIAATALAQRGASVDVVEHRPAGAVLGVGLIQPANALRVMAEIGVLDDCLAAGYQGDGIQVIAPDGTVLAQSSAPPPDDLPAAGNGIQRRELCRILLDAAVRAGARVFHGATIATITGGDGGDGGDGSDDDGVAVTFRGTAPDRGRYDLLLGFDGVRSPVRRHLFGERYEPEFTGFSVWRVSLPRPEELERTVFSFAGPVKATLIPLSAGDCYLALVAPEAAPQHGLSGPDTIAQMQAMLSPFGGWIGGLREAMAGQESAAYGPVEQVTVPEPWARGRILIGGDAAHATSPHLAQGAAMAAEDAIVLAAELDQAEHLSQALAAWYRRRRPRATLVQQYSAALMRQEQGEPTDADLGLLELPLPAVQARLAQPY